MLEQIDQELFIFLNSHNSPFWDNIMHFMSLKLVWAPLYLAILVYLGVNYKRRFLLVMLFIIVAVTLADQFSVLVKNSFDRLRPCHEPSLQGLVHMFKEQCGGTYGFVSSHASNSFNVAILSLMLIKKRWYSIFILAWASLVSYSRIYLGVHYPGDVIFGAMLGALVGWSIFRIYQIVSDKLVRKNGSPDSELLQK